MADERDFIGSGWSFPVRIDSRGGIALSRREQDVSESIQLVLGTPIGQRRMRPRQQRRLGLLSSGERRERLRR